MLSAFRRDSGALTQSLTALIAEGLISLEELAIDGTKVRARAGHNSLAGREKLDRIETAVAERVATLNSELEQDANADERKRQAHSLRAAEERARRIARAQQRLAEREQEKLERAKRRAKEERQKARPRYRPPIPMCARCECAGAVDLVAQIEQRCGEVPKRLLANATAMQRTVGDRVIHPPGDGGSA